MGSKAVEVSDGTCHVSRGNLSVNVSDNPSSFKNKACDSFQHTTSKTNTSGELEGVEKLPDTYKDSKADEDKVSCLSKANDTNTAFSNHNRFVERKNLSCSLASVGSVGLEEKPPNSVSPEMPPSKDPGADSGISKERLPEISGFMDTSLACPKSEAETSGEGEDAKQEALKCSDHGEKNIKSSEKVEAADMQPLQSANGDDSDESDTLEQDVKVCDICGDAGREEQLATCSKCNDGAEHIYCMRKKLRRVPKGDWLCEECKFAEQTENQKQGTDIVGNRTKKAILSTQLSNKRRADNTEAAPSSKRPTPESRVGSPRPSSPKRTVALSRDSSFKSMDKDKLKSTYQSSVSISDVSETARSPTAGPRLQTAKGALLKSNSFNIYAKPKVKLVDNILPQKQKGSKELDMKERAARMMGKSASFRSPDSGRSNVSESKVKMLSSKLNPLQDKKGLKQVKEWSTVERNFLSKLERPPVSLTTSSALVSTPKGDQASRGDTNLLSSVSNLREHKGLPSDGKLSTSKAISSLTRRGVETQSSPGGSSPISGMCSAASEQKSNVIISNNEPLSSYSWLVGKLPADVEEKSEDMLRSCEITNQTDKTRESFARSRPIVAVSSKSLFCSICKEIGHTAESCKSGISQAIDTDVSPPRSFKEEVPRGSRLKDAIHAALLRKPEIYRKKTVPDQSEELSASNVELSSEIASPEDNMLNNNMCTEGSHDGQEFPWNSASNFYKSTLQPANSVIPLRVVDSGSVVPVNVKFAMRDLQRHTSVGLSVLMKTTAIPEYEYIWQGSFELQRVGDIVEQCSGIQAHLSTSASPKVLELVNKFPHEVPLKEVTRLSVWPTQFHQSGVKEDNIALYFFAKDLDSYERNYKTLIDAMIKNDSALKGKFGSVELLILPSNHLPEKSQRWNMLHFLWGVFRETRVHYIDSSRKVDVPGLGNVSMDNDTPTVMSKNLDIGASERMSGAASPSKAPVPVVLTVSKDLESRDTYQEEMCFGAKENLVLQDSRGDSEYTTNNAGLSGRVPCSTPSLQEVCLQESRTDTAGPIGKEIIADTKNMVGVPGGDGEQVIREKVNTDRDEFELVRGLKRDDGSKETETAFVTDLATRVHSCQSTNRMHPHIDLSVTAASSTRNQEMPWNVVNTIQTDGKSDRKKPKLDSCELHGFSTSKPFQSHGFSTSKPFQSSSDEEMNCAEACEEKDIPEDLGTTERHFFPVESGNVQDIWMDNKSLPWKNFSSRNEDKSDGFPSLELALRAETKPPSKGNLPFFVGLGDERDNQDRPLEKTVGEEEDVSASLSLSLSFPFPDKEQPVKSEQLLPERHHVNTSLLLFGRFPEK